MNEAVGKVEHISITGFKSIAEVDLGLSDVNVLIGANGSGKSNFVSFFKLLNLMMVGQLREHVGRSGGADDLLFFGSKITHQLVAEISIRTMAGLNRYGFTLVPTGDDQLMFTDEWFSFDSNQLETDAPVTHLGAGHFETNLLKTAEEESYSAKGRTARFINRLLGQLRYFQFHDTSEHAYLKKEHYVDDCRYLRHDASNLAPFLRMLRETAPQRYRLIRTTVRRVLPFFDDFVLEPTYKADSVRLNWREVGSEKVFGPHLLSDGTLRFIALTALLMQPRENLPAMIIIDEPELGLHPMAVKILAGMISSAAANTQLMISTQSETLVNEFQAEDLIIVDRVKAGSFYKTQMTRPDLGTLSQWLKTYTLAEAWNANLFGGRPSK